MLSWYDDVPQIDVNWYFLQKNLWWWTMISLFENCSFLFRIRGFTSTHRRGGTSTSSNFSNSGTSSGPSSCPSMAGKAKTSIYSPKKKPTNKCPQTWCLYSPFSGDIMLISGTSFSPRFAGKVRIYACKPAYRPRLVTSIYLREQWHWHCAVVSLGHSQSHNHPRLYWEVLPPPSPSPLVFLLFWRWGDYHL